MKKKNVKRIAMALTTLMIVGSAVGCGATKDTATETTSKTETTEKDVTETVEVKKDASVVNKDKAQELADKDEAVLSGGDETVKKSDGSDVKAETQAPASTIETNGTVVNSNKNEVKPETTAEPTPAPSNNNSGGSSNSGSNNSGSNSNSGNSGGGSSSGGGSTESSTPAHVHSFSTPIYRDEPVYGTQRVQVGTKTVVDSAAWDEKVLVYSGSKCNQCGYIGAGDDMGYHLLDNGHTSSTYDEYKTVHHDAITHEEPVYEDRQVQTGTTQVVAGYKCSCGATQ